MRIFVDANVLFSAARSAGAIRTLLQMLQSTGHALAADAYVVAEARRNLEAKAGADALAPRPINCANCSRCHAEEPSKVPVARARLKYRWASWSQV